MNSLRPLQKAKFTDVLDYGIFLFKKHFKKLFIINLVFNIPAMLFITIFNPVFNAQYWRLIVAARTMDVNLFSSMLTMYAMLFGLLALHVIYSVTLMNVAEGSMIKILYADTILNREKTVKQAVKECFKQFGTLSLGRLLYILIQSAVFLVLYIVLLVIMLVFSVNVVGIAAAFSVSSGAGIILVVIGVLAVAAALFFIILTVCYFYGKYWMFLPAICVEQQKAGASFGRCNSLGRNSFFLVGLTFAAGNILVWFFPFVISSVFSTANTLSGNLDVNLLRVSTVLTQLFSEVLRPVVTCILTALYITLRVKREGLDMEMTLWEIKHEDTEKKNRWLQEAPNAN